MKKFLLLIILCVSVFTYTNVHGSYHDNKSTHINDTTDSNGLVLLPCVNVFNSVNKYADYYGIPINIAFGLVHYESGYNGIGHLKYNPKLVSPHKAYGACQIKLSTANLVSDTKVTQKDLMENSDLNISLAFKLLSMLKDKYGFWKIALGAYNTGKPIANKYASNIIKFDVNKIYKWTPNKG